MKHLSIRYFVIELCVFLALIFSPAAFATGLATCDSGPQENWVPKEELEKQLAEKGWIVKRIKVDGGCYEVYALNEKGERVEVYFHPDSLEPVPTGDH
jgi:hypothetical protein